MKNLATIELVDDCKAIITEAVFTSRWSLVEGYHTLGKRILEEALKGSTDEIIEGGVLPMLAHDYNKHKDKMLMVS